MKEEKILEKIDELRIFLMSDLHHFVKEEMNDKQDLVEYLNNHFSILEGQIKNKKEITLADKTKFALQKQ